MNERKMLRQEAKRIYKEKTKGVPAKNRIPFAEFFKRYKAAKQVKEPVEEPKEPETEDFEFEDLINVNDISEDDE